MKSETAFSPQELRLFGIFTRKGLTPTVAILYRYACGNVKANKRTDREKQMRVGAIVARVNRKLAKIDKPLMFRRKIEIVDGRYKLVTTKKAKKKATNGATVSPA